MDLNKRMKGWRDAEGETQKRIYDAAFVDSVRPDKVPETVQNRAHISPIWCPPQ